MAQKDHIKLIYTRTFENHQEMEDLYLTLKCELDAAFEATKDLVVEFAFAPSPLGETVHRIMFILNTTQKTCENLIKASSKQWLADYNLVVCDDA